MSVLIKGLAFPKDRAVVVVINPTGAAFVDYGGARFEMLEAVDVPAPHGRLIDADKFERDVEQYHLSDGKFQHWVQVQNTIIEAEEGDKNDEQI